MSMSTFQKVTLATCLVLCVALLLPKMLLPRGRKDAERPEGPGRFPPMVNRHMAPDGQGQRAAGSHFSKAHNPEAIARAKGAGTGAGAGGKTNLAGQIIPIYGFGILLYILYILFKITSKGSSKPTESRFSSVRSENIKRKITDFELTQLQEKLRETELVMESIVSNADQSPERLKGVSADQEENLLLQLREITRVMQEGRLVEDMAPEKPARTPNWEDYPKEPHQHWEHADCPFHHSGPQPEPEAQKTDGESELGDDRSEEVVGSGEAEDPPEQSRDEDIEAAPGTTEERPLKDEGDSGAKDVKGPAEPEGRGTRVDLGVPAEDLAGVLKELELTLQMTSMMEEKMEDLHCPAETAAAPAQVRRRNKKRKGKKDSH